ncbi:MAG: UvrB/UvrC motif-containing protein [Verrucomicrobia bacterium]|nr:UvrB/UvrC motif-containing protein [Verrucomicrobiota bacterium]
MSASDDIAPLLQKWPYDPENNTRVIDVGDRAVLQVRTPLGIEQYELEGRPDGARPHGCESLLEHHMDRRQKALAAGESFRLTEEECEALFQEAVLYYHRYVYLFQTRDWTGVIRDTTRNLRLFDFVLHYAEREEDRYYLEKWRPYLLRMRAVAAAMVEVERERYDQALSIIRAACGRIEALPGMEDETFQVERERALEVLENLKDYVEMVRPLSPEERLKRDLEAAVARQEFERAAEIRDKLRALRRRGSE